MAASAIAQKPATTLKVMTYNTYSNRKEGIEKIAEVIRRENPDIVALQEVERNTAINPWDTPEKMSELTDLKYHAFFHALDIKKGGDYGNVILSRYPLSDEHNYHMEGLLPKDYTRSFGYATVDLGDCKLTFAVTHLDHKYEDALRLRQAQMVVDTLSRISGPVILAGDLNTRRGSKAIDVIRSQFSSDCLADGTPWTSPAPNPTFTCDWILFAPHNRFKVRDYHVCYWASTQSDHFPVVATYEITK